MAGEKKPDAFERAVVNILRDRGHQPGKVVGYELPRLWREIVSLRYGDYRKRTRGTGELVFDLDKIAEGAGGVARLAKRMKAEIGFYRKLFEPDPKERFRISREAVHAWPDGWKSYNIIAFECPPGKPLGYTAFEGTGKQVKMLFFQGKKGSDPRQAKQVLGKPWFEVLMDRVVEAYRPLHRLRVPMRMAVSPKAGALARKVRDRYFRKPKERGVVAGLRTNSRRVKRILRPR